MLCQNCSKLAILNTIKICAKCGCQVIKNICVICENCSNINKMCEACLKKVFNLHEHPKRQGCRSCGGK